MSRSSREYSSAESALYMTSQPTGNWNDIHPRTVGKFRPKSELDLSGFSLDSTFPDFIVASAFADQYRATHKEVKRISVVQTAGGYTLELE